MPIILPFLSVKEPLCEAFLLAKLYKSKGIYVTFIQMVLDVLFELVCTHALFDNSMRGILNRKYISVHYLS